MFFVKNCEIIEILRRWEFSDKIHKISREILLLFLRRCGIIGYYTMGEACRFRLIGYLWPRERKTLLMNLILASASPRRREILSTLGVDFSVRTADADETCELTDPGARVEAISLQKCLAVEEALAAEGALTADTLIVASDTLVTLDGRFLGKPRDEADARAMLRALQGRTHTVASGLAVRAGGRTATAHELTGVTFAPMSDAEIEDYLGTGESFGKAGAYAIQGHAARYITGIEGDYFNVVGLPVRRLYETLQAAFGITL